MKTTRLTMAQAVVKFLAAQRVDIDGDIEPLFHGVFAMLPDWVKHYSPVGKNCLRFAPITNRAWRTRLSLSPRRPGGGG